MNKLKQYLWRLCGMFLGFLMNLLFFTVRIKKLNEKEAEERIEKKVKTLFALWHSDLIPLMWAYRRKKIWIPVSLSKDGEIAAGMLIFNGYRVLRGSSSRKSLKLLRDMKQILEAGDVLAITIDGPKGPARIPKKGILWLAMKSGTEIIPVVAKVKGGVRINSWDKMKIPLPFSKVEVKFGKPISPGQNIDDELNILKREMEKLEVL